MKRLFLIPLVIVLMLGLILGGCAKPAPTPIPIPAPTPTPAPTIPARFTTYTNETGLFSISYPSDWEPALSLIEGLLQNVKEIITSIESDVPVEKVSGIFFAGLPTETGYMPNVNIVVEPLPEGVMTHNSMVEAEVRGLKQVIQDYYEISRVRTTVGGREATIIEVEGTYPELGEAHWLVMFTLMGKTVWVVTCTASPEEFNEWREDFNSIVRSLRILE